MVDFNAAIGSLPSTAFSFAYGSGVFQQKGYDGIRPAGVESTSTAPSKKKDQPMIDMILAVDDPVAWHGENLRRNPHHYAGLAKLLGASGVAALQEDLSGTVLGSATDGGRLWYNTMVPLPKEALAGAPPSTLMKYGVISVHSLLEDCVTWKSLYVAGRLHKPVRTIGCSRPEAILPAARENLRNALRAALLLLPSMFTPEQLYIAIAALSYSGDWRMVFGENPHKVTNIVQGNISGFHALYGPILASSFPNVVPMDTAAGDSSNGAMPLRYSQDVSPEARLALGMSLPLRLQRRMADAWHSDMQRSSLSLRLSLSSGSGSRPRSWALSSLRSSHGRAASAAVAMAASGREILARLRQTRLQVLLAARERRQERAALRQQRGAAGPLRSMFQAKPHDQPAAAASTDGASAPSAAANLMETSLQRGTASLETLLREATAADQSHSDVQGPAWTGRSSNFARAAADPRIASFWDACVAMEGHSAEVIAPASTLLQLGASPFAYGSSAAARLPGHDIAPTAGRYLRPALAHIVGPAARVQSIKGILTAGPVKSALYASEKLKKYFKAVLKR